MLLGNQLRRHTRAHLRKHVIINWSARVDPYGHRRHRLLTLDDFSSRIGQQTS